MEDTQYNKKNAIVIGASGLAREIYSWNHLSTLQEYNIVGFMDDNPSSVDNLASAKLPPVVSAIDFSVIKEGQCIIMGISSSKTKERLHEIIKKNSLTLSSFVHSSVLTAHRSEKGEGVVLSPNVIISCDVKLGDLVFVNCGSQIGHDVSIGHYSSIMANVDIGGGAVIGKNVLIGSGATILPGVHIPDNTVIGAGSVVIRSIKISGGTYFGNPASRIL